MTCFQSITFWFQEKDAAMKAMLDRLGYLEDDKPPVSGITVKAATLDKMILLTANSFSKFIDLV